MSALVPITGSLLRGGGRRTVLDLSLTVVGVAIPLAIIIMVVGTVTGFRAREDAMAWREPVSVDDGSGVALQRRSYQPWSGRRIDVVELSSSSAEAPVPPGMDRFPADGEVWVSPGLSDLLADQVDVFEDRVGARMTGVLGVDALAYADELVAVVGDGSLRATRPSLRLGFDHRNGGGFLPSDVVEIAGFASGGTDPGLPLQYMVAAWVAGSLLVAPSISLLGAGARLTAARRGRRLAALRLAGATSRQVTVLAALETSFGALVGIAAGAAMGLLGLAVVSRIPLGGGRFSFEELVPEPIVLLAIVAGALAVAVASALAGLRGVRSTPLGVVRQGARRRPTLVRLTGFVLAWVGFAATVALTAGSGGYGSIVGGLGIVILSISMVGPLLAWVLGWVTVRLSRRVRGLVAGRRLMADPAGSFRPTTGIVLVTFVAGFLLLSTATMPRPGEAGDALLLGDPSGQVDAATEEAWRVPLSNLFPEAEVERSSTGRLMVDLGDGADLERARGRIAAVTGSVPLTEEEADYEDILFGSDVRKATGIVVVIALIQAAVATGVGAAASVLEQAGTLAALHLSGVPTSQLRAARLLQALIPISVGAGVCVTLGAVAGAMTIIGIRPDATVVAPSVVQSGLVVVAAAGAAAAGIALSEPVLRSVLHRPLAER